MRHDPSSNADDRKDDVMTSDCVCKEYSSLQKDDPLWHAWEELLAQLPEHQRFVTPEWFSAWNDTDGTDEPWNASLKILTVWAGQTLNGLLILKGARRRLFKLYSLAGPWHPWRAVLMARGKETEVSHAMVHHLMKVKFNLVRLGPCLGSSPALNELVRQLEVHGFNPILTLKVPDPQCFWTENWDAYLKDVIGKKFRKDMGRLERKLGKQGELEIRHFTTPVTEDPRGIVDDLAAIEGKSWLNSESGSPRFATEGQREFWTRLIQQDVGDICCFDLWIMYLDSVPISLCTALSAGKIRWLLATNYDQEFAKFSTGSILRRYLMKDGIDKGIETFDYGAGGGHFKPRWGTENRDDNRRYAVLPRGLRGNILRFGLWVAEKCGIKVPI